MKVSDVMKKDIITITKEATILEAIKIMKDKNIGFLIIKENNEAIGVITDRDIVLILAKEISINRFLFDNDIVEALVELEQEEAQEVYTDEVVIFEYDPYKEFIEKITTEDIETENKSED